MLLCLRVLEVIMFLLLATAMLALDSYVWFQAVLVILICMAILSVCMWVEYRLEKYHEF